MKKTIYVIISLFFQLSIFAQEGVNFRNLEYEAALEQAQKEGKLVFVDCYTSWCGPCKNMTNNVFPQKAAGDYFNPRFVCVKYDMEKGKGVELAKKFDIHAYPSFLIIRPDGTVQHKLVGGGELEEFIARVELGLNEETSLIHQHELYQKGGMSKLQLLAYKNALSEADDSKQAQKIYEELIAQLTDEEKVTAPFWSIYEDESCVIGSPVMNFMLAHLPELRANSGVEKVDRFLTNKYWKLLGDYVLGYNAPEDASMETLKRDVPRLGVEKQKDLESLLELADLVYHKKANELASLIEKKLPELNPTALKTYSFGFRTLWWKTSDNIPQDYIDLGNKLSEQIIAKMESQCETMTCEDLQNYTLSLSAFPGKPTKANYARLADLGEKIMSRLPNNQTKRFLELDFKKYRELSYSGVHFHDLSLEQMVERNKKDGRKIIVYGHSGKQKDREILMQEELGDYLNTRFACIQVTKKESKKLQAKHEFKQLPCILLLKTDGTSLLMKLSDIRSSDQIINTIQESLKKTKKK